MARLNVKVQDGGGSNRLLEVTEYSAVLTHETVPPLAPRGTAPRRRPYIKKIDLNNGGSGYNGSVTPVELTLVESDPTDKYNIYVQNIVIVLSAASVPFNRFLNINGGITNGIDLFIRQQGEDNYLAQDIKTNGEILIYAGGGDLMPTNPATINSFASTNDAIVATFDLNELIPTVGVGGVEIGRGTFDKIIFRIKDNLTGASAAYSLFAIVKGYSLYE